VRLYSTEADWPEIAMPTYPHNVVDLACSRKKTIKKQLLDELYAEHSSALRAFLQARLRLHEDVDVVVQEVFSKLAALAEGELRGKLSAGTGSNRAFV